MERFFVAAVAVQCIAITNASWHGRQRSFTTHRSLSLYSWCEWTPLAGLMTFLAEAVDLPAGKWRERIYSALLQSISCLFGIIFRFVTAPSGICMTLSMVTHLGFSPRLIKRQQFLQTPRGIS
jgi:hypothetical protein